jgi:hypothetical protein
MNTNSLQDEFIGLMKQIGEANFNQYRGATNIDWNGIRTKYFHIKSKLINSTTGTCKDITYNRMLACLEKLDFDDVHIATLCNRHRIATKQFRKQLCFTRLRNPDRNIRIQCWNNIQSVLSKQGQSHDLLRSIIKKRNLKSREKGYSGYIDYSLKTISLSPANVFNKLKGYENKYRNNALICNGIDPFDLEYIICMQPLDNLLIMKHKDKLIPCLLSQMGISGLQKKLKVYNGDDAGIICLDPTSDIRLLLTKIDSLSSYKSVSHEYGHAYYCNTYNSYQDYLFASNPITNEMHAMLFEKAAISPSVLSRSLKLKSNDALNLSRALSAMRNTQMRSFAATTDFCIAIYEKNNVDYAREYADCCRKYLNMRDVDLSYDFMLKLNIASNPMQYLTYAISNLDANEQIQIINSNKKPSTLDETLQKAIRNISLS